MAVHEDLSRTHDAEPASNRSFGLVFAAVFAIAGAWPLFHGGELRWWCLIVAAALLMLALAAPGVLARPNRLWLRFGLLLHRIVSPLVLAFMFYAVVTPLGALMRLCGKDNLRLRRTGEHASYWIKRDPPGPKPESLSNQF